MSSEDQVQRIQSTIKKMQDSPLLNKLKNSKKGVLVDISSSMLGRVESQITRHDVVQKVMDDHIKQLGLNIYWFNDDFGKAVDGALPHPTGGTDMANAFNEMKNKGILHVVLLSDGEPNSEEEAFDAAEGMQFDIIYIGNPPTPSFLLKLGNVQGNSVQAVNMITQANGLVNLLGDKIKKLLIPAQSSGTFYGK